MLRNSLSS